MRHIAWLGVLLAGISLTATAQNRPDAAAPVAPAPAPERTAPSASPSPEAVPTAPAAPSELREIEIIEVPADAPAPETPEAADAPVGRREIRIVEQDGQRAIWIDEDGELHDLGTVMDQALEFNPELRAIRAEIQALMARLDQLEMKTASDVVRKKEEMKMLVDKQKELKSKYVDSPELRMVDADIAAKKVELEYIVGVRGDRPLGEHARVMRMGRGDGPAPLAMRVGAPRPDLNSIDDENLKVVMDRPITINFEKTLFTDVVTMIVNQYEVNFNLDISVRGLPIDIHIKDVSLKDALAALSDANPDLVFIVRDYGIFATMRDRAISIPGPSIPEDVPYAPNAPGMLHDPRRERAFKSGDHVFEERKVEVDSKPKVPGDAKPSPTPTPKFSPNK